MSERITIDRGYFAEQLDVATKVERERIIKILKKNSSELGWVQLNIDELVKVIERESK